MLGDIVSKFGDYKVVKENRKHDPIEVAVDCPECKDGKYNLTIHVYRDRKLGVFSCWKCSTRGKIKTNNSHYIHDIIQDTKPKKEPNKPPEIPIGTKSILDTASGSWSVKCARKYLIMRDIDPDNTLCWVGVSGRYNNRIIFPILRRDWSIQSFIARDFTGKQSPKYILPNTHPKNAIFNIHSVNPTKPIFLVEGIFDSLHIVNSIAILGKRLYKEQLFEIVSLHPSEIRILLDSDTLISERLAIYTALRGYHIKTVLCSIDGHDPGSLINAMEHIRMHNNLEEVLT